MLAHPRCRNGSSRSCQRISLRLPRKAPRCTGRSDASSGRTDCGNSAHVLGNLALRVDRLVNVEPGRRRVHGLDAAES